MPLITHRVKENAKKCETCPVVTTSKGMDDKGVLYNEAKGAMGVPCKLCPIRADFKKVHGMDPLSFYAP